MSIQRINSFNVSRLLVTLAYTYFAVQILYAVFLAKGFAATWFSPMVVYLGFCLWRFMTNRKSFMDITEVSI